MHVDVHTFGLPEAFCVATPTGPAPTSAPRVMPSALMTVLPQQPVPLFLPGLKALARHSVMRLRRISCLFGTQT